MQIKLQALITTTLPITVVLLLLFFYPTRVQCLLQNCVSPVEWAHPTVKPRCEIITIYKQTCFGENEIAVDRPRPGPSVKPDQTKLICWAPYPIDVDVDGANLKGYPGIFYMRNSTRNLFDASKYEYTIIIPLVSPLWTPRWFRIARIGRSDVNTRFYFYSPGPNDKVLPYYWPAQKGTKSVVTQKSRFVVLPCTVTHPNDPVILKKLGEYKTHVVPVDNTTVVFDRKLGFILDTSVQPPVWGNYICEANNPRTKIMEMFAVTLEASEDFMATPPEPTLYSFSSKPTTLTCSSKTSIKLSGTLNGVQLPESAFTYLVNQSLLLMYSGVYQSNDLKASDSVVITCSNVTRMDSEMEGDGVRVLHMWKLTVLDINKNEILQFNDDGGQLTCSSNAQPDSVSLFNVECFNLAHCGTRSEFFTTLGVGQCDLTLEIIRCGSPCESSSSASCVYLNAMEAKPKGYLKCEGPNISYETIYVKGYDGVTYTDFDKIPATALVQIKSFSADQNQSIFVNTTHRFQCKASTFTSNGEFRWMSRALNGSVIEPNIQALRSYIDYAKSSDSIWEADVRFEESMDEIICMVPVWNSEQWLNVSIPVAVKLPTKPAILNKGEVGKFEIGEEDRNLVCEVNGDPMPVVSWYRDNKPVTSPFQSYSTPAGQVLAFPTITFDLAGKYQCKADSIGGDDNGEFVAEVHETPNITLYVVIAVILLVLLIITMLFLYWKLRRTEKCIRNLTYEEVDLFLNGNPEAASSAKEPNEMIVHLPFNSEFEIPRDKLDFDTNNVLGSGAFGIVYRGKLDDFPGEVAIKTLKPFSEISYFKSLLTELKVMIYLGKHVNVVSLIGAYTGNIKERVLYMVVELSPYGSLESLLRCSQKRFQNLIRDDAICMTRSMIQDMYANLNRQSVLTSDVLSTAELIDWSLQIANGMTHLESKKVIHADLATRNILLYENGVVKITDFGLSRQLYAYTNYLKKEQEPLPWRWMAIESLREMNFSTQSDVWGYGVALFEIFSLGAVPYPGLAWSIDFVDKLLQGLRLSKPAFATTEIYEVMVRCWHGEPDQRPIFHELRSKFEGIKARMVQLAK